MKVIEGKVKSQSISSNEDLELLIRGDVVDVVFQSAYKEGTDELQLAFHGRNRQRQLLFVEPVPLDDDYIGLYTVKSPQILGDGKLRISESENSRETIAQYRQEYQKFERTLKKSGLIKP